MPSLVDVVEIYMTTDEIAGLARSTQVRTAVVLRDLMAVVGPKTLVSRINRTHIDKVVALWRGRLVENSINNYKAQLRQFGEYLFDSRLVRENPTRHLKSVKTTVNYEKRRPLTATQARKVIKAAGLFHERDRVSVILGLYTALRGSELVSLRWRDVDIPNRVLRAYRGKVHDIHAVPLTDALAAVLTGWRAEYERLCGPIEQDWLVVPAILNSTAYVRPPSRELKLNPTKRQTNLRQRVKLYMKMAGVTDLDGKGLHVLRRTAGNLALDAGMTVRDVQHLLGHASERQTQAYLSRDTATEQLAAKMRGWEI